MSEYAAFLDRKTHLASGGGFKPLWMPEFLFDFQESLVDWSLRSGRGAIFADCGLGKTPMQLVWAENIVRQTQRPVLILTPLAVSYQTIREAEKFDIKARRSIDGSVEKADRIVVANYERLEHFTPSDFAGVVCDESSILKNFSGVRRKQITAFMRKMEYRLLCTATAAPNDYTELGTSSEALGGLAYMDILARFFKNDQNQSVKRTSFDAGKYQLHKGGKTVWRFRGHAEVEFWRWVASWSRSIRQPADLGFDNDRFVLPPLQENVTIVKESQPPSGHLFVMPAVGLYEQREQRKRTIQERCEAVAELVNHGRQALVWCQYNAEGDLLSDIIPDAVQISGSDSDEHKETTLLRFADADLRVLVTKPKIGAWGLNLQNCSFMTFFPSHSYEQYYQGVRRCWRFGQESPVRVEMVTTEGECDVLNNLKHKAAAADRMFSGLVRHQNEALTIKHVEEFPNKVEVPAWL